MAFLLKDIRLYFYKFKKISIFTIIVKDCIILINYYNLINIKNMILRKITLLLVLFLTVNVLFAQSKEEKKAMAALNSNKYAKAITLFKNAFVKTKDPARIANISFNTGLAYMRINNPKQAEAWFTKALKVRIQIL